MREISRTSDSGATKRKGFCANCGVPIYNKPDEKPEFIGIYVGSLDDATAFKPAVVLYCASGYAWDFLDPDVPKLPGWHPEITWSWPLPALAGQGRLHRGGILSNFGSAGSRWSQA